MAKAVRVFECPHCGRRTEAKLVNDVPHDFHEDVYECQQCYQLIRATSTGGFIAAGLTLAALIAMNNAKKS